MDELFGLGEYTPDYLTTPNGSALINETFKVLNEGVSLRLSEQVDPAFRSALEDSVFRFSGFKTHQELEEVSALLRDENGNLRPFDQFKQDVLKINDQYNLNYLSAEYNMAVQSAQMASKWKDFESHKDFVNLQYRTAGDDKVRAEHQALDGTTLPVEDPFWKEYLPPLGWNCRCTVVEVLKDQHPVSDSAEAIKAGAAATSQPSQKIFRYNPGKTGEIFPPKHPYYKVGGGRGASVEVAGNVEKASQIINKTGVYGNLTTEESKAIEENNKAIEKALGVKIGVPEKDYEALRFTNFHNQYGTTKHHANCASCTGTFIMRMRGFDVECMTREDNNAVDRLAYRSQDKWLNIDGSKIDPYENSIKKWMDGKQYKKMTPARYKEYIYEKCNTPGIYEFNLTYKGGAGHSVIIHNDGISILVLDPQNGTKATIDSQINILSPSPVYNTDGELFIIDSIERVDNKLFNPEWTGIFQPRS